MLSQQSGPLFTRRRRFHGETIIVIRNQRALQPVDLHQFFCKIVVEAVTHEIIVDEEIALVRIDVFRGFIDIIRTRCGKLASDHAGICHSVTGNHRIRERSAEAACTDDQVDSAAVQRNAHKCTVVKRPRHTGHTIRMNSSHCSGKITGDRIGVTEICQHGHTLLDNSAHLL